MFASIGTWVRSPGPPYFPIFFFVTCSGTLALQWSTMHPTLKLATCPTTPIQGPAWEDYHTHWSIDPHASLKSQKRPRISGPICFLQTSTMGSEPPLLFVSLSLFFFFFYLFQFNCFFLLIHQKIIFTIQNTKKSESQKINIYFII